MRHLITSLLSVLVFASAAYAQTESEKYEQRYNLLVSKLGPAGVGIETVLNNWEKVDSTNAGMLLGKFSYYYAKSQSAEIVTRGEKKYLGMEPVMSLKDSLGNTVYYYQEFFYDDELYGQAVKAADRAAALYPERLDFRFLKANAYISYEKESPDMALRYLLDLVDEFNTAGKRWKFDGTEADSELFEGAMQEYCFSFYSIGSRASREAFKTLSEYLLESYPDNTDFMNNIGSYHLLNGEYKKALKYYDKVLRKSPGEPTALQNGLVAARRMKNAKLEKKYLGQIEAAGKE